MFLSRRLLLLLPLCPGLVLAQSSSRAAPNDRPVPPQGSPTSSTVSFDVSGRVLNGQTHQPIARALVQLGTRRVLTDHDGIFHLPQLAASTASFRATKPGFFSDSDDSPHLYTLPTDTPIELTLNPEAILSGSVIDTNAEPVSHLFVSARRSAFDETGHHWIPAGQSQTLSDGTFRLSLPAGVYSLQAIATGRPIPGGESLQSVSVPANPASIAEAIHLAPGEQVHLDLRPGMRRVYDVALRIEHGPERAFPILTARPANGPPINLPVLPNRDNPGAFHVALPNGTYEIVADMRNQNDHLQGRTSVTVAGHDIAGVQLPMAPTPVFPVVLEVDSSATSDNATPAPAVQQLGLSFNSVVSSANLNEQTFTVSSRGAAPPSFSLPEGTYHFRARPGTSWYVTAATCGGTDLLQQNLSLVPGAAAAEIRVRVSNKTADLTGSVQLTGAAIPAWIYLIAAGPSATPILALHSGSNGAFSRASLPPGTYRIVAFEHKVSADLQSPDVLNHFLGRVQTLTLNAGDHPAVTLNAVPAAEIIP